jgi:hypothetical protein
VLSADLKVTKSKQFLDRTVKSCYTELLIEMATNIIYPEHKDHITQNPNFIFVDGIQTRCKANEAMQIPQQAVINRAFNSFEKHSHFNNIHILHIF